MLKLIIADDERVIRENIRNIINWDSLGIEVIGLCKNGVEAYDMIIDENPDIVMTDIRMPGLSGIELISRLQEAGQDIEYVILSGYSDFEYAKKIMRFGVKYYLLKPCNEEQIIEVMNIIKGDCLKRKAIKKYQEGHQKLADNLNWTIIRNIFAEGMMDETNLEQLIHKYTMYFDFRNTEYQVLYFYYLSPEHILHYLNKITAYFKEQVPGLQLYTVYVKQTLLVFFESFDSNYVETDQFFTDKNFIGEEDLITYERQSFMSFASLLEKLLVRLRRFEVIKLIHREEFIPIYNYHGLIEHIESLSKRINKAQYSEKKALLDELNLQLSHISDINFLKVLISNILLNSSMNSIAQVMISEFLMELNTMHSCQEAYNLFRGYQNKIYLTNEQREDTYKEFINEIISYVHKNISNPGLSLKWIADNHLYMNADYVSREFVRVTGTKFSAFLTDVRINKAKQLLINQDVDNIYIIADKIGFGNNPHYFSRVFKKETGMTPTKYMKYMNKESKNESNK